MRSWSVLACLGQVIILSSLVAANPTPRQEASTARRSCNTPNNRACWVEGFDINTDWEANTPVTGVTRTVSTGLTEALFTN